MLATMIFSFSWSLQLPSVQEQDNTALMQATVIFVLIMMGGVITLHDQHEQRLHRGTDNTMPSWLELFVHMISRYISSKLMKMDGKLIYCILM